MFQYYCLNPIAQVGLDGFGADYKKTEDIKEADGVLVRSAAMHDMELPEKLLAVARAGAGVNNIPLDKCAEEGIVVFNTPGANANGVKELVFAGMLYASRDIVGGIEWVAKEKDQEDIDKLAEKQKEEEKVAPKADEPRKDMGFISVSIGEGMNEIFRGLGVDYIIEGGQTMNPSTEDMLSAIDHVNADHIFILPNNKNIIMAANQAASLVEDKEIIVLPTKTIPQGIVAMVNYIPDYSAEENKETMLSEIDNVKTGQVTYAVRDTEIDGKVIKQNDFMGIGDKEILSVGTDLKATTLEMIDAMVDEDSAIVSIYYGTESNEKDAEAIGAVIGAKYPDVEVEINNGGQPIYYYVISVE